MDPLPQRALLTDQVAESLRRGLASARWVKTLPSESELCRELQISRMTLRRAMAQLVREQWIQPGGRGRHHQILRAPTHRSVSNARTIRILTPFSFTEFGSTEIALIENLSSVVSLAGYRLEIECHPRLFEKFQPEKLAQLNAQPDTAAWGLFFSTAEIQRWFAACGRPVVVFGRLHDALPLSSIFPDTEALARHVAGLLVSKGHRELVYLIANLTSLGDRLASETFAAEAQRLGARARIVKYEAGTESAGIVVRDLIASQPRPTGYVIGASEFAVTVLCYLLAAGIRIPAQASMIAAWDDKSLINTYPTIARYHSEGKEFGRQIGRILLDLLTHGTGKIRTIPIIPEYVSGGSVGNLRQ